MLPLLTDPTSDEFMRHLTRPLLIVLAIVFLVEAWLWQHLEPLVAWIVALIPLRRVKDMLRTGLQRLPPPLALLVFVVPAAVLFPLKLLSFWLIAHKHIIAAGLVFGFAKLIGVGITAFVFEVTRPKLLQMAWFRWLYERVLLALAWAHRLTDPIKHRIRRLLRVFRSAKRGRALRLMWRIRRRAAKAYANEASAPVNANATRAAPRVPAP